MTTESEIRSLVENFIREEKVGMGLADQDWAELEMLLQSLRQEGYNDGWTDGYDDGYREGDMAGESWGREHCGCSD